MQCIVGGQVKIELTRFLQSHRKTVWGSNNPFDVTGLSGPWKHQKAKAFLIFLGGIERDQWHETGHGHR